jgi:hypothetical protein
MAHDAALLRKPNGEINAHGREENAGLVFDNDCRSHNEPEGSIGRIVQRVDASSLKCKAGNLHSGVEQLTITQAERHQRKERERKGKERQRKRATTQAALEEALAQVETAGASLDTLNALDAAIVSAKRIREHGGASSSTDAPVVSLASGDLPEAVEASRGEVALNLRCEMHAMAKAAAVDQLEEGLVRSAVAESSAHIQEPPLLATLSVAVDSEENENLCVVCLATPMNSAVLPCKHLAMCAGCTEAVFTLSRQPQVSRV